MNQTLRLLALATALLAAAPGCAGEEELVPDPMVLPPHCNPLSTDHCVLPWPSSFYLAPDATTATGYRVSYPLAAMPTNAAGRPVDPARYNLLDGFPIAPQILVFFAQGFDATTLPADKHALGPSLAPESPIWLVEHPGGARVPFFVELDATAEDSVPALILRPQVPLRFDTRYVVLLRQGITDAAGAPLVAPEGFARLRDGRGTTNPTLERQRARTEEVVAFLEARGVPRAEMLLAWDFHTASHAAVTGNVTQIVEDALRRLPAGGPDYEVLAVTEAAELEDANLYRRIALEMKVPSYVESDELGAWLKLDAAGRPAYRGAQAFPFYVHIPACAAEASAPLPILIFGTGLFTDPGQEMLRDYHTQMIEQLCMVTASAQWRGLSNVDLAGVASQLITDFTNIPQVTDQLQQSHVNVQSMTELMLGRLLADPALRVGGRPVSDGKEIYYLGISNGGIQGVGFAALNRRIERFVLHVPGGVWSMMIPRSSNFNLLATVMKRVYADAVARQLAISLTQHLWEHTDPVSFAEHVLAVPLPGRSPKRVAYQEAIDDDQVPNIATRVVARALGIPQLAPAVQPVDGLEQVAGPQPSALTQWDIHPEVRPPETNTPADRPKDLLKNAHDRPRYLPSFIEQVRAFLRPEGQVVHSCAGPCDPD